MSDLEGAVLSEYLLLKCISKGGTADVYRARQQGGGNYEVAVKVFRPGYAQRKPFRDYFMAEADKIGQLDHPNILPFLEFGEGEGLLYTVTPFVSTGTLMDLLERVGGKLSAMLALPIMQQLCTALQYAHDHDLIHGNIKPTNIFIAADGRVLLSDFGIARGYDDSQQSLTRVGWGSAEYAAPEQSLGVLRRSSDIYASGVLLFRMLAGRPPFIGQTPVEVLLKHVRQQPPTVRVFAPSISDAVNDVLAKAMQKRSDDRFSSARELSDALTAAVNFAPVASPVAKPVDAVPEQVSTTPLPPSSLSGPQTPPPTHIDFASWFTPLSSPEPLSPASSLGTPRVSGSEDFGGFSAAPTTQSLTGNFPSNAEPSRASENFGAHSNFLQENDDFGTNIFEWVGPVEWSPLGNGQSLPSPESAGEYLRSMPVAPEVPPTPLEMTTGEYEAVTLPQPGQPQKAANTSSKSNSLLKKMLPVLVVILLLLGLLAALLSSFLYPGEGAHSNNTGPLISEAIAISRLL
jgi:serine/threonine protein kinase